MSRHPNLLHARAALWSLRAVWPKLEAAQIAAETAQWEFGDLGTVQAWRPGSGVHGGPHGDALLDAVIRHNSPGANPYTDRLNLSSQTLEWISDLLVLGSFLRPAEIIDLLIDLPALAPRTAGYLAAWIDEQDRLIRKVLGEPDDYLLIPGIACPACDTAGSLAIRTSVPHIEKRVIICTSGCTCSGPGCACRMTIQDASVSHIWTRPELEEALTWSSTTKASAGEPRPRSPDTSATEPPPPPSATGPHATASERPESSMAPDGPRFDIPCSTPPGSTPKSDTPKEGEPAQLDARSVN